MTDDDDLICQETELKKPTVQDIIDYLSQFPPDSPFRIEDPDTGWTIITIYASQLNGTVWFRADYSGMDSGLGNK